jgi:hypothetical protein
MGAICRELVSLRFLRGIGGLSVTVHCLNQKNHVAAGHAPAIRSIHSRFFLKVLPTSNPKFLCTLPTHGSGGEDREAMDYITTTSAMSASGDSTSVFICANDKLIINLKTIT